MENISQSSEVISQTWKISAKAQRVSTAKAWENISQSTERISQTGDLSDQPKYRENHSQTWKISGSEGISQTWKISQRVSAKLGKYQPKLRGNQPNLENISQSSEGISQTGDLSAKAQR
ncbi:hypothetical protein [Niallia sp. FSL K6-0077]|uniref:hypothetical protein n=1 Tax=Niallia sp. FSL K6-0077 TaxID=2954743 RepID=UPI0030FB4B95